VFFFFFFLNFNSLFHFLQKFFSVPQF